MPESQSRSAAFVRGFFSFLESEQVPSAILHGGENGFERELSDVDFVVDRLSFPKLPALIDAYCTQMDWQLCQVLRHETTAAYFVCSASDDPACAVALDACSDYQRNGTVFLSAEDLLLNLTELPWGGFGLSPSNELCYRFAKAAAKCKNAHAAATEFARYSEEARRDCVKWLIKNWGISLVSWNCTDISRALAEMLAQSNKRPSLLQAGAPERILSRIVRPTGLVVIAGHPDFDVVADRLESVFAHLYFRTFKKRHNWHHFMIKDLVTSTLIVIPEISFVLSKLIPPSGLYRINACESMESHCKCVAKHLYQRCKRRES